MTYTPPEHTPQQWQNAPSTGTPLDKAHLESAEVDLVDFTRTGLSDLASKVSDGTIPVNAAQALAPTTVKTSTYTAAAGDFVPVDISSGSVSIPLPSAPADKTRIGVKLVKVDGSHANACTISAAGSDVFNIAAGSTTLVLTALFQGVLLQYKASGGIWYVSTADTPLAQPLGAAKLGTDGTVGGPSGSGLTGSVVTATSATVTGAGTVSHPVELLDATAAPFTRTLPTAVGFAGMYILKAINSNANVITIATTSAQTIQVAGAPASTVTIGSAASVATLAAISLVSDGSNWFVV